MGITTVSNSQSYCEEDLWCYLSLPLHFLPPPHPHHPQSSSKSFSWSLPVRGLFSCSQNYVWKFPIVYCLQECPQISIPPYIYAFDSVIFEFLPSLFSYLSNLGWFCDLLWSTEYRSIIIPVQVVLNPSVALLETWLLPWEQVQTSMLDDDSHVVQEHSPHQPTAILAWSAFNPLPDDHTCLRPANKATPDPGQQNLSASEH